MGDDKAVGFGREPFTAIGFRPLIRWLTASRAALVAFICQTDEDGQGSVVEGQGSGTSHGAGLSVTQYRISLSCINVGSWCAAAWDVSMQPP